MTGYTVHTGSTEKFAEGWDAVFRKAAKPKKKPAKAAKTKAPAKKKAKKR
jgi:hypothetical protein